MRTSSMDGLELELINQIYEVDFVNLNYKN